MKHNRYAIKNLDPYTTSFLIALPLLGIAGLIGHIYWEGFNPVLLIPAVVMYALTVFAISGGYHRLFSHRTYKANNALKLFYLIFGAASGQNSALKWSKDHRLHHRKVDTKDDPYNIKEGFFYAHMGWVLLKNQNNPESVDPKDLMRDPLVMWQHKHIVKIAILSNVIICLIVGFLTGSYLGSFAIVGFLRLVIVLQIIFCINSYCHTVGSKPYDKKSTARDSHLLSILTFGESYHNFHHTFESDFRNGFNWYEWDPTKWFLVLSSKLGLTKDLIRTPTVVVKRIKEEAKLSERSFDLEQPTRKFAR